jgi:hypothetical protein
MRVRGAPPFGEGADLLADDAASAAAWIANLGGQVVSSGRAFLVPVASNFPPPEFGVSWTVKEARQILDSHCTPETAHAVRDFLRTTPLPITLALSLPEAPAGTGRRLVAMRLERATKDAIRVAESGFRKGHVPIGRILQVVANAPVAKINLDRVDAGYLLPRAGASTSLLNRTVALVGVGAVGSEIARNLAAIGIGKMRLVDHERMAAANVHRHVLGVRHLGRAKADALADELRSTFPHLQFESIPGRVEDLLSIAREKLLTADIIVIALGEETIERRLNRLLMGGPPRVHSWLEPLGVGGHALACGLPLRLTSRHVSAGCYECLFESEPSMGLVNRSSFVDAGQSISRSLAGCAGTFSPFSAYDSRRTALEAAELAASVLTGSVEGSVLKSWRGDAQVFEDAGYRLSRRGRQVEHGARVTVKGTEFANSLCPVCGEKGS